MKTSGSELAKLFSDHWEAWMKWDPVFATQCGDQRYNDRLPASTESAYADWLTQLDGFRVRLEQIASSSLEPADRLNYDYFARMLTGEINELRFQAYRLPVSKLGGFHTTFPTLYMYMPFETTADYENYLARLNAMRGFFEHSMELMRRALDAGFIPPRVTLDGVVESIETQIVSSVEQSPFYEPFKKFPNTVTDAEREKLSAAAKVFITESIIPAYEALAKFIREEYAPRTRKSVSSADLPNGRELYRHRIRYFTTLDLTPEEIHAQGHAEVKRIRAEMADVDDALHARVGGGLGQVARAVDVGGEQVTAAAMPLRAGEVDDGFDPAHGGAQAARIGQGGDGHLERHTGWKSRGARRGADERAHGDIHLEQMTHERASDESRTAGDQIHAVDYKARMKE